MNNIINVKRNKLLVDTTQYKFWLREGHPLASDSRVKQKVSNTPNISQNIIWKSLY